VEIDSAVEFSGGGVILHGDHSWWGQATPVIRLVTRRVRVTLSALQLC
jgi:hypothetical protein